MKHRNWSKRVLALLLAFCLTLGLAGCGDGETETSETETTTTSETTTLSTTEADAEEYGYLTQVEDLDLAFDYISDLALVGDAISCYGGVWNEETGSYDYAVAILDLDGTVQQVVTLPDPGTGWYQGVAVGDDAIWAVTYEWVEEAQKTDDEEETGDDWTTVIIDDAQTADSTEDDWAASDTTDPESWGTESEETEASADPAETVEETAEETETGEEEETEEVAETAADETAWVYEEDADNYISTGRDVYTLWQLDMDGQTVYQAELTTPEGMDYFYVNFMAVSGSGDLVISCDTVLLVYDQEATLLGTAQAEGWILDMTALADGTMLISYYDADYNRTLACFDAGTQTLGEQIDLELANSNYSYTYWPTASGALYAQNTVGLYCCDLENGTMEHILDWLDYDVDASEIYGVVPLEDGNILVIGTESLTGQLQTTLLERVPASELPVKTELTLGVASLNYAVRQLVLSFNRANSDYRIVIRDYSEYSTDEDYAGWADQMALDILSGDCPDILCANTYYSSIDFDAFVRKGMLVDLYTLMSEDTVQKEDLVESYCRAMEIDGGLYTISSAFEVTTVLAPAAVVGTEAGWTMEEFAAAAQDYTGEGQVIWNYATREDFLSEILTVCYSTFVDKETGQCSFDGEEFLSLLELCMLLPEDYTYYDEVDAALYDEDDGYITEYDRLCSGTLLVSPLSIYSLEDMRYYADALTGDLTLIGIPGVAGNGAVITNGSYVYAISAYSEYQDVAWEFIATMLTEEYAEENVYELSVLQSYLEKQAEEAMVKPYYYDENGEKVEYDDAVLTQEQVDLLLDVIYNAEAKYVYDEDLIDIVLEETAAYFAGQKDAGTVAALIQDRAQTYLDEQS